ncbi:MAG: hypothetical protein HPY76_08545, partial [Anaerolineae bacterium]|nr:hypothetical protein [Anaerolineae bacterium]
MIDLPTRVIPRANNGRKFDEKDSSKPAIFDWLKNPWQLLSLPLLLYITIPLVAIFIQTPLSDLFQTIKRTQVVQAVTLSLVTSLSTTVITWVIGSPVAYLLAQRRSRFHRVIDSLVDLPTVLPPAVAGVALLMAYGRRGLFGPVLTGLGINIPFTMLAVIMAQTFIASPLYIKSAAVGFSSVD